MSLKKPFVLSLYRYVQAKIDYIVRLLLALKLKANVFSFQLYIFLFNIYCKDNGIDTKKEIEKNYDKRTIYVMQKR